jgi:hypothetical protein
MMPLEYTGASYIGFTPNSAGGNDSRDFRFFAGAYGHIYFDISNQRIDKPNVDFSINNWYTICCYNNAVIINNTSYTGSTASNSIS